VVVHLVGPVIYLNATRILDGLRRAASHAGRSIIVDASRLGAVDATGALALTAFATWVERNEVEVVLAGLSDRNDAVLGRAGFWSGSQAIDRTADVDEAIARGG
jgi:MFS superfamily sulfate permease-like transporter